MRLLPLQYGQDFFRRFWNNIRFVGDDERGQTYNYLYWKGEGTEQYNFSRGFCVAGADTAAFLEDALAQLGLTRKGANEFIIYWLPWMEHNPYNRIAFQQEAYTQAAKLTVTPAPAACCGSLWHGSRWNSR